MAHSDPGLGRSSAEIFGGDLSSAAAISPLTGATPLWGFRRPHLLRWKIAGRTVEARSVDCRSAKQRGAASHGGCDDTGVASVYITP